MSEQTDLEKVLRQCCGSEAWVRAVLDARRERADLDLMQAADAAWDRLDDDEWKAAFAAHQPGVPAVGDPATRDAASVALRLYEERFGYPFVTAGSTRAADELLMRVRIRLGNDAPAEWRIAREEQRRSTRLRLQAQLSRSAS